MVNHILDISHALCTARLPGKFLMPPSGFLAVALQHLGRTSLALALLSLSVRAFRDFIRVKQPDCVGSAVALVRRQPLHLDICSPRCRPSYELRFVILALGEDLRSNTD